MALYIVVAREALSLVASVCIAGQFYWLFKCYLEHSRLRNLLTVVRNITLCKVMSERQRSFFLERVFTCQQQVCLVPFFCNVGLVNDFGHI